MSAGHLAAGGGHVSYTDEGGAVEDHKSYCMVCYMKPTHC